jgi:surface-anchored protein
MTERLRLALRSTSRRPHVRRLAIAAALALALAPLAAPVATPVPAHAEIISGEVAGSDPGAEQATAGETAPDPAADQQAGEDPELDGDGTGEVPATESSSGDVGAPADMPDEERDEVRGSGEDGDSPVAQPLPQRASAPVAAPQTGAAAETRAESGPLPGQSDQPAPVSRAKQIVGNVHTDAVSAYLDGQNLVLQSKYDAANGSQIRFDPQQALYHLSDKAKTQIPSSVQWPFVGKTGDTIWLATQVWSNHDIIWPGFSTEDPKLRGGAVEGNRLKVRLLAVDGPGRAELFLQETFGTTRIFSSQGGLGDWTMDVPQHAHMNWAFTSAGTYTFTFEVEGRVLGKTQRAQNDYTFVVGDLASHTLPTATGFEAEYTEVLEGPEAGRAVLGEPVTFTASVDAAPASGGGSRPAVGAVQFRDETSGTVLGHSPVDGDGTAKFRTSALPSGDRAIVAEFVPTWSSDFSASKSERMVLTVTGEAKTRPGHEDRTPIPDGELRKVKAGAGVQVTSPKKTVQAGQLATAKVTQQELRGEWVSVWLHARKPVWLGWVQTNTGGNFSAAVPANTAAGGHSLVLKDRDGALVGWDTLNVAKPADGGSGPGGGTDPGSGTNPGGGTPPSSTPVAPTQQCTPAVVLDHGHIDAFNVSVGGGQAVLQIKEDVTAFERIREAETVALQVKEDAWGAIPAGIAGAPSRGYMLPLSQDPNLIWPGWNTKRFVEASGYTDVSINIMAVEGPGDVFLATQGSFGGWEPILTSGAYALPGTIPVPEPAHTHAAWVFSQKGVYKLTVGAVATNPGSGRSLSTATHTYVFQVGDVPLGNVFCEVRVNPDAAAAGAAVGAAVRAAGAQAVAASQTKTATQSKHAKTTARGANGADAKGIRDSASREAEDPLDALLRADMHPAAIAGIVGGGALALSGIIGGTIWFVRRIGAGVPPLDGGT